MVDTLSYIVFPEKSYEFNSVRALKCRDILILKHFSRCSIASSPVRQPQNRAPPSCLSAQRIGNRRQLIGGADTEVDGVPTGLTHTGVTEARLPGGVIAFI
jgi:hypothetical protein